MELRAIQAKPAQPARADASPGAAAALRPAVRGGESLPNEGQNFLAPLLGHDFSRLRLHADGEVAEATPNVSLSALSQPLLQRQHDGGMRDAADAGDAQTPAPAGSQQTAAGGTPQGQTPPTTPPSQAPGAGGVVPTPAGLQLLGRATLVANQPVPPGSEGFYNGMHFIVYADRIHLGGGGAWRCNNCGALRSMTGAHARQMYPGAISIVLYSNPVDVVHGVIIFEEASDGVSAQARNLERFAGLRGHTQMTIGNAMRTYAEGDPRGEQYVQWVTRHCAAPGTPPLPETAPFLPEYISDTADYICRNEGPRRGGIVLLRNDPQLPDWARAIFGLPAANPAQPASTAPTP